MACRMERDINSVYRKMLVVFQSIDECLAAHAGTQDMFARCSTKITITTRPSMIGVGVGDNSMRYGSPWIDIEITDRAEEAVGCDFKKIGHGGLNLLSGGSLFSVPFSDMLHCQQPGIDSHRIQMERSVASRLGRPPALFRTFSTSASAVSLAEHNSGVGPQFQSHMGLPLVCKVLDFWEFENSGNSRISFSSSEQLQRMKQPRQLPGV